MYAYRIAYDGVPFHGFQRQPDVRTVEDELLGSLRRLDVLGPETATPEHYAAAGRTDAGVSATAQTIAFEAPSWLTPAAFNSELPESIRVWARADAPSGFHATHHANSRTYTYFLYAPAADREHARQAANYLSGTHDFHNLTPDESGTRRTVSIGLEFEDPFLCLTVQAGGFPRQLVRRLVRSIEAVATGKSTLDHLERLLSPSPVSGPDGVGPAPAEPLVLTTVSYPDISFTVDEEALDRTQGLFEELSARRLARSRVATKLATVDENGSH